MLVQSRRDKGAALRLMRKLLKKHGFAPKVLVTDKSRSYGAACASWGPRRAMNRACTATIGRRTHPGDPTTRDAAFQVADVGATLSLRPCRRPQSLQPRAPSDLPSDAASLSSRGRAAMAKRDSRRVSRLCSGRNPARRDSRDNAEAGSVLPASRAAVTRASPKERAAKRVRGVW